MKKIKITSSQAKQLLQMVAKTKKDELSCDDVHSILGQYTEMALSGLDVAALLPLVHHHLEMCPDCREEYEALSQIVLARSG